MIDQLVSFNVAKLAKEKGFNVRTHYYYFEDEELRENKLTGTNGYYGDDYCFEYEEFLEDWNSKWKTSKDGERCLGCSGSKYLETYSAPTQSLLQKWLREVHKIHVEPQIVYKDHNFRPTWELRYDSKVSRIVPEDEIRVVRQDYLYSTYEQALEGGLVEALKLI